VDNGRSFIGTSEPSIVKIEMRDSNLQLLVVFSYFAVLFGIVAIFAWVADSFVESRIAMTIFMASVLVVILIIDIVLFIYRLRAKNEVETLLTNGNIQILLEYSNNAKTKFHRRRNFAIAALGDLKDITQLPFLINILLSQDRIPWSTRRITAYAIGKLGTYEAVSALNNAFFLYKEPVRKMRNYSRYESIRIRRTQRTIKKILEKLAKVNGYENIQMLV
jgi:HEAT repeat protein